MLGDTFGDALSVVPKTQGLDTDSVLGAAFGITFNDNTLQTFEKDGDKNLILNLSWLLEMLLKNQNQADY